MLKVTIYWETRDTALIRAIRTKYNLPQYTTINGETDAVITEETLTALRRGEPKYLLIRRIEKLDKNDISKRIQSDKTSKT